MLMIQRGQEGGMERWPVRNLTFDSFSGNANIFTFLFLLFLLYLCIFLVLNLFNSSIFPVSSLTYCTVGDVCKQLRRWVTWPPPPNKYSSNDGFSISISSRLTPNP